MYKKEKMKKESQLESTKEMLQNIKELVMENKANEELKPEKEEIRKK